MQLIELYLSNYRNFKQLSLSFNDKINIFIGENGQGKTNLLESIYFMSITKSFKTSKLNEIIKFKENETYLKAVVQKSSYHYIIECDIIGGKKKIKINNNSDSKFKDVIGLLNAVLFVPEDLQLIKGSPKQRRKLLDIELVKIYPKYLASLSAYYHILKQRNAYLKGRQVDDIVLDIFDKQLALYGKIIHDYRVEFIEDICILVNDIYHQISEKKSEISMKYQTTYQGDIYDNLKKNYEKDLMFQQTTIGLHRDDFNIYLNSKEVSSFASQGEQRTIILAIKLALVEYIHKKTQEYPILLLDDVMSELDLKRQENLIKFLNKKVQTFITTTNTNSLNKNILDEAKIFKVKSGELKEVNING